MKDHVASGLRQATQQPGFQGEDEREASAWASEHRALGRACVAPGTGGDRSWVSRTHITACPCPSRPEEKQPGVRE